MKTCGKLGKGNKENRAPAAEISTSSESITYPVLPSLDTTRTTTTANVPKPSIPERSPQRQHHPVIPASSSTVPPSASPMNTTIPNRPSNPSPSQQRQPLFLTRNHHSHSTDIEILQSAGRQACLKRGLPPATPCNVGRPRVKLGFLTESPARKGWGEGVRRVFAGAREESGLGSELTDGSEGGRGRSRGGGRVERTDEVGDDEFEDAVVLLDGDEGSSRKSNTRPGSRATSGSEEEGGGAVKTAKGVRSSEGVVVSGRTSPGIARLPLSRRNIAMLDTVPTHTSSLRSPHLRPGPVSRVRGSSRFAPRLENSNTSAGSSTPISRSRYDTSNAAGSFSPSRMFDAPPRRNPARLTKAKEKQASTLSKVHVPTDSVVSAFSNSSEEDETDSSTPAWTDDEIFLRRHENSRGSKGAVARDQNCLREEAEKGARRSGTSDKGFIPAGEVTGVEAKTAMSADGLALDVGSVAIRSKRKQRGKKVRTGAKLDGLQDEPSPVAAKRTLEGLGLNQGGE
ncbi:hypothetical protein TI39_contig409g00002 [Zymoseptoria brevis]|uniref:Uncharacterized protein n=1 Tax=Zymoseptoria brevis TaxID=1047168 RepID=A0A0F4GMP6_9PEZI|nr:hypothetical protein TI39_contig409g00002 [Zymoseptoria brevis]